MTIVRIDKFRIWFWQAQRYLDQDYTIQRMGVVYWSDMLPALIELIRPLAVRKQRSFIPAEQDGEDTL